MILINELRCNNQCKYCYVVKNKFNFSIKEYFLNILLILMYEKEKYGKNSIRFFGGEALLNIEGIYQTLDLLIENNYCVDNIYINTNLISDKSIVNSFIKTLKEKYDGIAYKKLYIITTYMGIHNKDIRNSNEIKERNIIKNIKLLNQNGIDMINNYIITNKEKEDLIKNNLLNIVNLFGNHLKYFNFIPLAYVYNKGDRKDIYSKIEYNINQNLEENKYKTFLKELENLIKNKKIPLPEKNDYFSSIIQTNIPLFCYDFVVMPNGFLSFTLGNIEEALFNGFLETNLKIKEENIKDFNKYKENLLLSPIINYIDKTFYNKEEMGLRTLKIKEKLINFFGEKSYKETVENYIAISNIFEKYL